MEMNNIECPPSYGNILEETQAIEFNQLSDGHVGAILAALSASKQSGRILELGTGTGLSTSWLLAGMCANSKLITVDSEEPLVDIARRNLGHDSRVSFYVGLGEDIIDSIEKESIDLIFADTWPGKYRHLDDTLALLKTGGLYVIDDMLPQENWPEGHDEKAQALIEYLESREDLVCAKMSWSTGVMVCTKVN